MHTRWTTIVILLLCLAGLLPTKGQTAVGPADQPKGFSDSLLSPQYHYTQGIGKLHIHQDTSAAQEAFLRALKLDSLYAPALYKLSEVASAEQTPERALAHARRASELDSTNKFYLEHYARLQVMTQQTGALQSFRRLIRLDRHNPDNFRILALLEEQAGRPDEAVRLLDSASVLFGRMVPLERLKRRMLIHQGKREEVFKSLQQSIEQDPYEVENLIELGHLHRYLGEDSLAVSSYHRALELDTANLKSMLSLAELHSEQREYYPYLSIMRRIFEHPDFLLQDKISTFQRFTSDIRFYREYYPQLNTLARTLALRHPQSPEVVRLYGDHLLISGEGEQALAHYKLHLDDEPPQVDYYTMTADLERYFKRPDSAYLYLDKALKKFPDNIDIYLRKSMLQASEKRFDEAEATLHEAFYYIKGDSIQSLLWGYMGDVYQLRSQGDYPSAEAAAEAAGRAENKKAAKEYNKWLKKAFTAYDKALTYNNRNISVLNNYAYFLSLAGRNLERALEMSSRVVALEPKEPSYLDTHAWVLYSLGRYEEAKRLLQQAVSLDGQRSATLQLHYGDVLSALGENFMAEVYWKRALENGAEAAEVERRIETQKQKQAATAQ